MLAGIGLLAAISIGLSGLAAVWKGALCCVLAIALVIAWRRAGMKRRLVFEPDGTARLDGVSGVVTVDCTWPLFVAFTVVSPDRRRARAGILFDELEDDDFRKLLMHLRARA